MEFQVDADQVAAPANLRDLSEFCPEHMIAGKLFRSACPGGHNRNASVYLLTKLRVKVSLVTISRDLLLRTTVFVNSIKDLDYYI